MVKQEELYRFIAKNEKIIRHENFSQLYKNWENELIKKRENMFYMALLTQILYEVVPNILDYLTEVPQHFMQEFNITDLSIPSHIKNIGSSAFYDCRHLKNLKLNNGLNSINSGAFWGCYSLSKIVIPDTVNKIDYYAFYRCIGLKELVIPKNIVTIDKHAFDDCNIDANIIFKGTKEDFNRINLGTFALPFKVIHCVDGDIIQEL